MLQAKLRVPMRDCNSFRVHDFLCCYELSNSTIHLTLSGGSWAFILSESSTIPMNSITLLGPTALSATMGMLRVF